MQRVAISFAVNLVIVFTAAAQDARPIETPTGKLITPLAAPGAALQDLNPQHPDAPNVRADGPASLAASPDGTRLAILAGGFNSFADRNGKFLPELSTEYVFLFDITGSQPKQLQALPVHASFQGLAWAPSSKQLFVSGGIDDTVTEFVRTDTDFRTGLTIHLGHKAWNGPDPKALASFVSVPCNWCFGEVGGLAVSPDGTRLLVANVINDSVSLIDLNRGRVIAEQDLRPGVIDVTQKGKAGGSYPRAVLWTSPNRAYVVSERDREVIVMEVSGDRLHVGRRVPVRGQPVALVANRAGSRIYVALDTTSQVAVLDTVRNRLIETLDAVAPQGVFDNAKTLGGANTNALVLTPDERTLLVSNGGENALAVIALSQAARDPRIGIRRVDRDGDDDLQEMGRSKVVGLVPTGWYPSGVAVSKDGTRWYIANGKTPTGPNSSWCTSVDPIDHSCRGSEGQAGTGFANQHLEQRESASLLNVPAPSPLDLAMLTSQVARNNHFDHPVKTAADERLFSFLRAHIKHVIYIMKENQTYDAILGDLNVGNGDPRLTLFPERITPNHHAIARNFVDLDNTLVSGEGSPQGWTWTYAAQTTDYNEWNEPHFYAQRGIASDMYGNDRGMNMGLSSSLARHRESALSPTDPDILPGTMDVNAPDGPDGDKGRGYIWDAALRGGLSIRNYGLAPLGPKWGPEFFREHDPFALKQRVNWPTKASLIPFTDPYYLPHDVRYPDFWREQEWKREFDEFSVAKKAPNLIVMWLGNDHTGAFAQAIDGVNTPETQVANNDYALGLVLEAVSRSPFANDTLVVSIEDDAWNDSDHVDSHRTVCLFAGPYVRQHAVVSTRYTTVSVLKTINEILGIGPIGLNDALAAPMSEVFDPTLTEWSYKAIIPNVLRSTKLPLPPDDHAKSEYPRHSAAYWAKAMKGQDFSGPDRIEPISFNRTLWRGLKGNIPYPAANPSRKKNRD